MSCRLWLKRYFKQVCLEQPFKSIRQAGTQFTYPRGMEGCSNCVASVTCGVWHVDRLARIWRQQSAWDRRVLRHNQSSVRAVLPAPPATCRRHFTCFRQSHLHTDCDLSPSTFVCIGDGCHSTRHGSTPQSDHVTAGRQKDGHDASSDRVWCISLGDRHGNHRLIYDAFAIHKLLHIANCRLSGDLNPLRAIFVQMRGEIVYFTNVIVYDLIWKFQSPLYYLGHLWGDANVSHCCLFLALWFATSLFAMFMHYAALSMCVKFASIIGASVMYRVSENKIRTFPYIWQSGPASNSMFDFC